MHATSHLARRLLLCVARLRKTWLEGAQFAVVGPAHDLTYPYEHLGDGPDSLATLRDTRFFQALKGAQRPLIVLGAGVLSRPDRAQVLQQVPPPPPHRSSRPPLPWIVACWVPGAQLTSAAGLGSPGAPCGSQPLTALELWAGQLLAHHAQPPLPCASAASATWGTPHQQRGAQVHSLVEAANVVRPDWNGYNIMHDSAGRVGALDLGFLPGPKAAEAPKPKLVWLLNSDDFDAEDVPEDAFVIYQVRSRLLLASRPRRPLPQLLPSAAVPVQPGDWAWPPCSHQQAPRLQGGGATGQGC